MNTRKEYHAKYYIENKQKINNRNLAWYESNKEKVIEDRWVYNIKKKFNMTPKDYEELLKKQNGHCAICPNNKPGGRGKWHIDHCHKTNQVRGLLCQSCNMALGLLNDNVSVLNNAIEYLMPKHNDKYAGNTQWL